MAGELQTVKDAVAGIKVAVGRAATELKDLAGKITNTTDPAELAAIAADITATTEGLHAAVDEVDTDGSSPKS